MTGTTRRVAADLPYPVKVEPGCLAAVGDFVREVAPAFRYAIITDSHVGPLYGNIVAESVGVSPDDVLAIPAGESSKTRGSWGWLTDQLLTRNFGRDSAIISLGGGVVGDVGGFVAEHIARCDRWRCSVDMAGIAG